jgi:hypothetical protein
LQTRNFAHCAPNKGHINRRPAEPGAAGLKRQDEPRAAKAGRRLERDEEKCLRFSARQPRSKLLKQITVHDSGLVQSKIIVI